MGTIIARKRADGTSAYTAQIRLKAQGKIIHSEAQTFERKAQAQGWLRKREYELHEAKAAGQLGLPPLTVGELLRDYAQQAQGIQVWGRTKQADIRRLQASALAARDARQLTVADILQHAMERRLQTSAGPATVLKDVIWLRQAFLAAVHRHGLREPLVVVDEARQELQRQRVIGKPRRRTRRLSAEEEQQLLAWFARGDGRARIPMGDILRFALLTARRQEEICRLRWEDIDRERGIAWLDDVKHPTQKQGNRRSFRLLRDALEIVERQPRTEAVVFPYKAASISAAFTRACKALGLEDLHFHDLRHEATSRLFEKGYSIQEVAQFTLHDSWANLRRYTHLRPENIPEK